MTLVIVFLNLITSGSKHKIRKCVRQKERLKDRDTVLKISFIVDLNTCIPSNGKNYSQMRLEVCNWNSSSGVTAYGPVLEKCLSRRQNLLSLTCFAWPWTGSGCVVLFSVLLYCPCFYTCSRKKKPSQIRVPFILNLYQ
jgi:hypothetical protein